MRFAIALTALALCACTTSTDTPDAGGAIHKVRKAPAQTRDIKMLPGARDLKVAPKATPADNKAAAQKIKDVARGGKTTKQQGVVPGSDKMEGMEEEELQTRPAPDRGAARANMPSPDEVEQKVHVDQKVQGQ